MANGKTTAFSVERVRAAMLERIAIPTDILNKAIRKVHDKLEAKETKFFTFQGQVIQQAEVEDNAAQLAAADKILSVAGLYARERETKPPTPTIAIEVDPVTGVVRMVIGGDAYAVGSENPGFTNGTDVPPLAQVPEQLSLLNSPHIEMTEALCEVPSEPVQVVKVRGNLKSELQEILFGNG